MAVYTVRKGDTLSGIAKKLGIPNWRTLYEQNKAVIGSNYNLIRPGQKLTYGSNTPTPAQAANGSLTGTVPAAPSPQLATYYRPAVVAYRLDQPGDVRTVDPSPGATYRLKVPAGLWAVQTPRWVNGVLDPASQVVPVAGGRTVAVRARADAPPPIRISAAEWTSSGLAEPEITGGIGDLMINDLVTGAEKCNTASGGRGVAVVEDRQGHRWRDVLREIKLGMSRYADPEFRAMAKRATVNIKAWAPTHRLVGHMSQSGDTFTATASLVNTKTGKTQWTKTYTVPATGDGFFGLSDTLPADVMRELCKPVAPLRVTITGRLTLASAPVNASADVALQYDAAPIKGDETNFSPTEPATWQVSSTAATATDPVKPRPSPRRRSWSSRRRRLRWSTRPRPRSMRPGNRASSILKRSATISGAWFVSIMPPAPTRMFFVAAAT